MKSRKLTDKHPNTKVASSRGKQWRTKLMAGKLEAQTKPTRLRLIRLERQINQISLAKRVGLSTATYGSIERGKRPVSVDRARKIAQNLGGQLNTLFSSISAKKMLANSAIVK